MENTSAKRRNTMGYKGVDYETVILSKLGAMEALLKSFMSSLEEPLQKKGELDQIYAPASGEVQWYKSNGSKVGPGELLGVVTDKDGETWDIRSPAIGTLTILVEEGEVRVGKTIAYIELMSILV